jgi:hypothetical protein
MFDFAHYKVISYYLDELQKNFHFILRLNTVFLLLGQKLQALNFKLKQVKAK